MKSNNILTQCVHGNRSNPDNNGGVLTPIYTSTAYNYLDADPLNYPRYFNTVNQKEVASKIALLENGEFGMVFSSGLAAITSTLIALLKSGDHAIFQGDIYGGTHYSITRELTKFGVQISFTRDTKSESFKSLIRKNTKLIFIETPSNPLLKITNLKEIAAICQSHDLISVIDNTFASPINQKPIDWGIDIVTHSGTKYLGGHSDITSGAVVTSKSLGDKIYKTGVNLGGSLDPQTCYLLDRSLKTLALRVRQQNENAQRVADFLIDQKNIKNVYYPGLTNHPDHSIAKEQMSGFGGMLSFEVKSGADSFVKKLKLIKPAISLGSVESTISSPMFTSHSKLSEEERQLAGITPELLRLSVGIEDAIDIINDLKQSIK